MELSQFNQHIVLNCGRMLGNSRIYKAQSQNFTRTDPSHYLKNWITINKTQLKVISVQKHTRMHSLDSSRLKQIQKISITFRSPKRKTKLPDLKTRCTSTGSGTSFQDQYDYLSQNKYTCNKNSTTFSKQIQNQIRNYKDSNINEIKGLKSKIQCFPLKKINLGSEGLCIKGKKLN